MYKYKISSSTTQLHETCKKRKNSLNHAKKRTRIGECGAVVLVLVV